MIPCSNHLSLVRKKPFQKKKPRNTKNLAIVLMQLTCFTQARARNTSDTIYVAGCPLLVPKTQKFTTRGTMRQASGRHPLNYPLLTELSPILTTLVRTSERF